MKTTIYIIFIFLLGLVCSNCSPTSDKEEFNVTIENLPLYNLKIALDTTFDSGIIDSKTLLPLYDGTSSRWTYDSVTKTSYQNWDSLIQGDYTCLIKTIFRTEQLFRFSISSDTSFVISNQLELKTVSLIQRNELLSADTIEFVYTSNGCFHAYFEKSILVKNKNDKGYFLKTNANVIMAGAEPLDVQKNVSSEIIEDLFVLQNDSKKQKDRLNKSGLISMSTTRQNIYLLANGKLFQFDDIGIIDWDLYDNFKTKYITQTKGNGT